MKNLFRIILITVLTFSSLKVNAATMANSEVKSIIAKQVKENYKNYTSAQIDVEVVALPFKDLYVPEGNVSFTAKPSMDKFMARDLEKVSVYVNDQFVKSFNAPVVIKAYENVLVATGFINIGQPINSNVATAKRIEISNILDYPLRADALGKEMMAKKAFREGEVLDKRFVKLRPEVVRNATVTVVFKSNNLSIVIDARALSDGVIGESICLMNKNYNKVYTGKVIGENKVLVEI
jgi:flagella basal body P-ring formation protein FlgA